MRYDLPDDLSFELRPVAVMRSPFKVHVGTPVVDGASVKAEVLRHGRTPKIIVFKRKRRKGYRKKQGHRQGFTEIRIDEVALA